MNEKAAGSAVVEPAAGVALTGGEEAPGREPKRDSVD
jgi:hypothetical protein